MRTVGVIGAGTWGLALARMLSNIGNQVTVWSSTEQKAEELARTRRHPNLPGMVIPEDIRFTNDMQQACGGMDILVFAVASVYVRSTAAKAAPYLRDGQVIVEVAKGIEPGTLLTMTGVIRDELQKCGCGDGVKLVALSGPTHAEEVSLDMPSLIVAAGENPEAAEYVQDVFMSTCMRVYTNPDVLGVELCGAMKNIIALAAGVSTGLGYGDNARAALITRGMAEITRLGKAMGCLEQTFSGLAGIGDLIVTATSRHSRNNRCGMLIGSGVEAAEAVRQVGMVVEGVNAIPAALSLAERYGVEMPIVEAADRIINHGMDPAETVSKLMNRGKKSELTLYPC